MAEMVTEEAIASGAVGPLAQRVIARHSREMLAYQKRALLLGVASCLSCALLSLQACEDSSSPSSSSFDAGSTVFDAPAPIDTGLPPTVDAADTAPAPACDPTKAFGAPVPLSDLNSPLDDTCARLSSDLLTAYLTTDRNGSVQEIFTATRATPTAAFATPTILPVVNFAGIDTEKATISGDGLTLFTSAFTTLDGSGPNSRIYTYTRASTSANFSTPTQVAATVVPGSVNQRDPYITPDGNELYFCSDAQVQLDIYVAKKVGGVFGAATRITELAAPTFALSCNPFLSADGLTLYFFSNRAPNVGGVGNTDIWVAHRPTRNDPFTTPTPVNELNTVGNDEPVWLSADACTLWFARSTDPTDSGIARTHLYRATKPL
jgi:hypothetical protein